MGVINKYKSTTVQVRATFWYTFCSFLQNGITFLLVPIYLQFLSASEYGKWTTYQAWKDILIVFTSLNLYCGVYTKKLVDIREEDRDRYTSSMQGLGTLVALFFLGLYLMFQKWIGYIFDYNKWSIFLMFGYFITFPSLQYWLTRQRVEYKYKKIVIVTILLSVIMPITTLTLLSFTDLKAYAIIYGYMSTQIVFGLFFYILHFIKDPTFINKENWYYALKFNIPLIPHYISLIILGQSDRLMIKGYCGYGDAGIYSFGYQIASVMSVIISAINGSRVPWTYENLRDRKYKGIKDVSLYLCLLLGIIVLIAALLSPEIVRVLTITKVKYNEYFYAVYVIPIVALGLYFTFVYDLFCSVEFYYGRTKYIMFASCVGALLNVILNAFFIPKIGLIAAAYTTLCCYIVFMIMHYIFMKKICREENIREQIYKEKTIFVFSVILSAVVVGCNLLYQSDIVRLILMVLMILCLILWRRSILQAIGSINAK